MPPRKRARRGRQCLTGTRAGHGAKRGAEVKNLFVTVLAITLVIPVFLVIISIDAIPRWLVSGPGHALLAPLCRLFAALGTTQCPDVAVGLLLAISFVVALAAVAGGAALWRAARP
jgi:hypothetical protein